MRFAQPSRLISLAMLLIPCTAVASEGLLQRLMYVVSPDGAGGRGGKAIYIYDMDDGHRFVRKVDLPLKGTRGVCASAAMGRLWISHGETNVLCLDLNTDKVLWEKVLPRKEGCDRLCCTPDGKKLYVPSGTWSGNPEWKILDGNNGEELGRLRPHKSGGGHNAVVSLDGTRVYCASKANQFLAVVDTATDKVIQEVGPVGGGIHPFTIRGDGTLCYLNTGRIGVGFEVGDLKTGKILAQVKVPGLEDQKRLCHGIALSPDEKEIWLNDVGQLHVFDVSGASPRFVETIKLSAPGHGWTTFSIDGRFAYPDSGDVFDARTRKVVARLTDQPEGKGKSIASSKMIEVHFQEKKAVAVGDQFGLGRKSTNKGSAATKPAQSDTPRTGGAKPLFASGDLSGWVEEHHNFFKKKHPGESTWSIKEGIVVCDGALGNCGFLRYEKKLSDFTLTLEYRMSKSCNSGVCFRTRVPYDGIPEKTLPSGTGYEIQIQDDAGQSASKTSSGAIYGRLAPRVNAAKSAGEWNRLELTCQGPKIRAILNGQLIHDFDHTEVEELKDRPKAGYLALQNHGHDIEFRNLRLEELGTKK